MTDDTTPPADRPTEPATRRPTLAVDFDGVIHAYTSPWTSPLDVHDPPVPGALDWLRARLAGGWTVVIHTARLVNGLASERCSVPEIAVAPRVEAIRSWLAAHGGADLASHPAVFYWTEGGKPHADVYLDDRALRFDGRWPTAADLASARVPWNRRDRTAQALTASVAGVGLADLHAEIAHLRARLAEVEAERDRLAAELAEARAERAADDRPRPQVVWRQTAADGYRPKWGAYTCGARIGLVWLEHDHADNPVWAWGAAGHCARGESEAACLASVRDALIAAGFSVDPLPEVADADR